MQGCAFLAWMSGKVDPLHEAGLWSSVWYAGLPLPRDLSGTQSVLSEGMKPSMQKGTSQCGRGSHVLRRGGRADLGGLRLCVSPDMQFP